MNQRRRRCWPSSTSGASMRRGTMHEPPPLPANLVSANRSAQICLQRQWKVRSGTASSKNAAGQRNDSLNSWARCGSLLWREAGLSTTAPAALGLNVRQGSPQRDKDPIDHEPAAWSPTDQPPVGGQGKGPIRTQIGPMRARLVPHAGIAASVRRVPTEYGCYGGLRPPPVGSERHEGTNEGYAELWG